MMKRKPFLVNSLLFLSWTHKKRKKHHLAEGQEACHDDVKFGIIPG